MKTRTELVRRFVEGSILGWVNYLHGDRSAAVSPRSRSWASSIPATRAQGIGAIDPARVKDFHDRRVKAGLFKAGEVDLSRVYTTEFVNKGVGVELRRTLAGATK